MPIFIDRLYCRVMRQRAQRRTKSSRGHTDPNRPLVIRSQGFNIPTLTMHGPTFLRRPTHEAKAFRVLLNTTYLGARAEARHGSGCMDHDPLGSLRPMEANSSD